MPEFIIEVTSKRIFGPFTYPTSDDVMNAIVNGELNMGEVEDPDQVSPVVFKIKEAKDKTTPLFDESDHRPENANLFAPE